MIPKIYKEEIFRIWQFFFCNICGIKGLLLRKISQIYFFIFKFSFFFFLLGCTTVYFIAKRALDKQSFITKSQALIHGKSLLFFFSYLHLIASQVTRMKKATVHIFSPLHMSIILEMSMAKPALHKDEPTPSPMRKTVSLKKNKQKPKRNKKRGLKALVPHCVGIRHIPSWLFFFVSSQPAD